MAAGHAKDARVAGKGGEKVKRKRGWTVAEERCRGFSRDARAIAEEAEREREREREREDVHRCTRNRHLKIIYLSSDLNQNVTDLSSDSTTISPKCVLNGCRWTPR